MENQYKHLTMTERDKITELLYERKTKASGRQRLKNDLVRNYVQERLMTGWSPEIIAGRIKKDHPGLSISHEAVYQYIYHPQTPSRHELIACLRRAHRKRKHKGIGRKERKTKIPNRISIDARPKSVETRHQFGHWEGDSLVSRKSVAALNSLTERKSRLVLLTKLDRKGRPRDERCNHHTITTPYDRCQE